jgi:hypothetical protein
MRSKSHFLIQLIFSIIVTFILFSCKEDKTDQEEQAPYDKQIRYEILCCVTADTTVFIPTSTFVLFNKSNYIGVDSIVYAVTHLRTTDHYGKNVVGTGEIELYDITNHKVIQNSKIVSDDTMFIQSNNIFKYLPSQDITLSISFKSLGSYSTSVGDVFLFLYRK